MCKSVILSELTSHTSDEVWIQWENERQICKMSNLFFLKHLLHIHLLHCAHGQANEPKCSTRTRSRAPWGGIPEEKFKQVTDAVQSGDLDSEQPENNKHIGLEVSDVSQWENQPVEASLRDAHLDVLYNDNDEDGDSGSTVDSKTRVNDAVTLSARTSAPSTAGSNQCSTCGKSFTRSHDLRRHTLTHTGERPHKCQHCHKKFVTRGHLARHLTLHEQVKAGKLAQLRPSMITISEERLNDLLKELKTKKFGAGDGEIVCKCPVCSKTFERVAYLKTHLLLHAQQRRHVCQVCGQMTIYLKKHMETKHNSSVESTRRQDYRRRLSGSCVCEICGKIYSFPSHLKSHLRRHTGERNHSCADCGKSFSEITDLRKHHRTHTGEKRFCCDICGLTFSGHMARHMRIHEKEMEVIS